MNSTDTDRPQLKSTQSHLVRREPREADDPSEFDIVAVYTRFLEEDASMTMPVAAVEALVELLSQSKAKTISEFLDLLQRGSEALKTSVKNSISLSAGCDLFQRWVVRTLQDASVSYSWTSGLTDRTLKLASVTFTHMESCSFREQRRLGSRLPRSG